MLKHLWIFVFILGMLGLGIEFVVQTNDEQVQVFLDTDRDPATGYGHGHELLMDVTGHLRHTEGPPAGASGWGKTYTICVPLDDAGFSVETYTGGAMQNDFTVSWRTTNCGGPDIDRDGDVDLADFALFQASWTGP